MKGGASAPRGKGKEWRTGTAIDNFTPVYRALLGQGITPDIADGMDLTVIAVLLGVPARGPGRAVVEAIPVDDQPLLAADGTPAPATAPPGMRKPSWWVGDSAAFSSAVEGARELGLTVADDHRDLGVDPAGGEALT